MEKQQNAGIFSQNAQDRVRSPEELDNYIRVVQPGTMILALSLALVLVALIVWGCIGTLPVTKSVSGVMTTRQEAGAQTDVYFFLNAYEFSGGDLPGKEVIVSRPGSSTMRGTVVRVEPQPFTREEILRQFGSQWIVDTCVGSDYSWVVTGRLDGETNDGSWSLVDVTMVTENVHPISFLFR